MLKQNVPFVNNGEDGKDSSKKVNTPILADKTLRRRPTCRRSVILFLVLGTVAIIILPSSLSVSVEA